MHFAIASGSNFRTNISYPNPESNSVSKNDDHIFNGQCMFVSKQESNIISKQLQVITY